MKISELLQDEMKDLNMLKSSDGFSLTGDYLRQGNLCDSSANAQVRMTWVHKALEQHNVMEFIVKEATRLCEENLKQEIARIKDILA